MSSKTLVQDELEVFESQIEASKQKLVDQRNVLIGQRDNYETLFLKILNDNNNAIFQDKIMILIGDGYFVEKNRKQATQFLKRRISHLSDIIEQFTERIESCTKLLSISTAEQQNNRHEEQNSNDSNEEGLPFIDIVENLDEDGNVISVKINNKPSDNTIAAPQNTSTKTKSETKIQSKPQSASKNAIAESNDPVVEALDDIKEEFIDIVETLDEDGNVISVKFNNEEQPGFQQPPSKPTQEGKQKKSVRFAEKIQTDSVNKPFEPEPDSEPETELPDSSNENNEDQFNELLEDMEIISKPKSVTKSLDSQKSNIDVEATLNKIDNLKVTREDKSRIKEIVLQEIRKKEEQETSNNSQVNTGNKVEEIKEVTEKDVNYAGDQLHDLANELITTHEEETIDGEPSEPIQDHIMIENKDLLELELIANNFQDQDDDNIETGDADDDYDDDEEYEFDFEEEEEEEEDDDEDDYEQKYQFFGDKNMNNLLWNRISQLRQDKQSQELSEPIQPSLPESDTSLETKEKNSGKKSVLFSNELKVHEIDRISPEDYEAPKKLSRFKQLKEREHENLHKLVETSVGDVMERPVGDIVENPVGDIVENPVGDIVENPVGDIMERPVVNVVGQEHNILESRNNTETEVPIDKVIQTPDNKHGDSKPSGIRHSENLECAVPHEDPEQTGSNDTGINDSQELMDMIKQYNAELDSIEGPVINDVEDISRLNKLQEKIQVDDFEIHDHDHDHEHEHGEGELKKEASEKGQKEGPEDNKIMTDILEKDYVKPNEEELKQSIERENLEALIQREYYNMKTKLNTKEPDQTQKEFEQLDTAPRASKFKQRLNRR